MPVIKKPKKAVDRGRYLPSDQQDWPETLIRIDRGTRANDDWVCVTERDIEYALRCGYRSADRYLHHIVTSWIEAPKDLTLEEVAMIWIASSAGELFWYESDDEYRRQDGLHLIGKYVRYHEKLHAWLIRQVARHVAEAIALAVEDPSLLDEPDA